jgi:tellurite resistance protein TerC
VLIWVGFLAFIVVLLAVDLGLLNRKAHVIPFKEAMRWTILWVTVSLLFTIPLYYLYKTNYMGFGIHEGVRLDPTTAVLEYLTAYILEYSLSLDNIFLIALIFGYFKVPELYQHRLLFWGILGALIMRGAMIALGAALIHRFEWITYVFGVMLLYTAFKLLRTQHEEIHPENNPLFKLARKMFPVTEGYVEGHFFVRQSGKLFATPMFLVLVLVESTDVMFAIDSIPAVFGVTRDPFLVFTSNIFAILGLRSLFFVLAGVMNKFKYLEISLCVLLAFIGIKMLGAHFFKIPPHYSLLIIGLILGIGVVASIIGNRRDAAWEALDKDGQGVPHPGPDDHGHQ